jgi:phosphohistidine phosphatase
MRRLLLLRHAKSSWATTALADHDRPLAPRGIRAVGALRRHVAGQPIVPDVVLCSTARRTVETWEGIAPAFPPDTRVDYAEDLYGATSAQLLRRLRQVAPPAECVLVIGHNPGIADLASRLAGSGDLQLRRRLGAKFPTGALATLLVAGRWTDLGWGTAELADYVVPRQLDPTDTT